MSGLSEIIIIAGPNGAGKTTFAHGLIAVAPDFAFINADEIAREVPNNFGTPGQQDLHAGRMMLDRISAQVELRRNIMFETTLANRSFAAKVPKWQSLGYEITPYYLRLPTADTAVERVKQRVADGGHNIPEAVIRRRFTRSIGNFETLYKGIVDAWSVYDGQTRMLIASGRR